MQLTKERYQLMPPLSQEEYEALKADIAERGVQVPVEYDEQGNILDGHHRVRACKELGIGEWPSVIRRGMSEEGKVEHALALNLSRRHLSREQRQELVVNLRGQGWSLRRIAAKLGVSDFTVRKDIEDSGAIKHAPATVTGVDGKQYPATRPSKPAEALWLVPQLAPAKVEDEVTQTPADEEHSSLPGHPLRRDAALRMSESNEWYTPAEYIQAVRAVLGSIDLDPASCAQANETVQAATYYTSEQDGLQQRWFGKVFCNPPYGGLSGPFAAKLVEEYRTGNVDEAILLVNANSTDTQWFQPLWDYVLCFTDHRINFIAPQGSASGSTHGSVFVYLGSDADVFASVFGQFGAVVARYSP